MMNCDRVQSKLVAWMDGELTQTTADWILAHLEACPICAQAYRENVAVSRIADEWRVSEESILDKVMADVEAAEITTLRTELRQLRAEHDALREELAELKRQITRSNSPSLHQPSGLLFPLPPRDKSVIGIM